MEMDAGDEMEMDVGNEMDPITAILSTRESSVNERPVSHRPISPPLWSQLPSDIPIPGAVFTPATIVREPFRLDSDSQCSCGNAFSGVDHDITIDEFTVYTETTAVQCWIQTTYCGQCRNTRGRIGPDLREYGILNWNNRIGYSHELMNNYTSAFTNSETPIVAFHKSVLDTYLSHQSPIPFPTYESFKNHWFGFISLQQLASSMKCSRCGPNPKVVIADGIAVSFPSHKVARLRPPTDCDSKIACVKIKKTQKMTGFPGLVPVRDKIYKSLMNKDTNALAALVQQLEEEPRVSVLHLNLS